MVRAERLGPSLEPMKSFSQRGSVLIATLFFLTVVIVGVAAVFDLSNSAYKLAQR